MKIAVDIDPKLLETVMEASGEKTESGAVNAALAEYARRKNAQEWIDSWGKIIVDDYSADALRLDDERRAFLDSIGREHL